MRATKYTITVEVEVLSTDSVCALLSEVAESYSKETTGGRIHKADGDEVKWDTSQAQVEC